MCTSVQLVLASRLSEEIHRGDWSMPFGEIRWPSELEALRVRLAELGATTVRGGPSSYVLWISLPFDCARDDRWCRATESDLERLNGVEDAQFKFFGGYRYDASGDRYFPAESDPEPLAAFWESYPESCEFCFVTVDVDTCGLATVVGIRPELSDGCRRIVEEMVSGWSFVPATRDSGWVETRLSIPLGSRSGQ